MKINIGKEKIVNISLTILVLLSIFGSFVYFYKMDRIDNVHFKGLMEMVLSESLEIEEVEELIPEPITYHEEVLFGDGMTNVVRRVVSEYINENGMEVENERKIFLEDYIQKRIDQDTLAIGEIITIQEELIIEAFSASGELSEDQLNNLKNYSALVKSFN